MNSKTFVILLIICAILGGAAYLSLKSGTFANSAGKLMIAPMVNDINAIRINAPDGSVNLKKADVWFVENRYNFPANFSMIADFVLKLRELKIDRSFKATEEILSRLALRSPEDKEKPDNQKGIHVVLEDKDKKPIADLILGATRETPSGSGGHYLKFTKDDTIYLVDKNFRFLDKDPSKWIDKELLKASADDIESVTCIEPINKSVVYVFKRPEKGKDPEMLNMPQDKKLAKSKISSLFSAIASFQCDDLADPTKTIADTGMDLAKIFEFRLFDGRIYRIYPGKSVAESPEKYYFKTDADFAAPSDKPNEASKAEKPEDKQKKEAEKKQKQTELAEQTTALSKKLSTWTFIVPKWRYDNFVSDISEFFEKEKTPPAEEGQPQ